MREEGPLLGAGQQGEFRKQLQCVCLQVCGEQAVLLFWQVRRWLRLRCSAGAAGGNVCVLGWSRVCLLPAPCSQPGLRPLQPGFKGTGLEVLPRQGCCAQLGWSGKELRDKSTLSDKKCSAAPACFGGKRS